MEVPVVLVLVLHSLSPSLYLSSTCRGVGIFGTEKSDVDCKIRGVVNAFASRLNNNHWRPWVLVLATQPPRFGVIFSWNLLVPLIFSADILLIWPEDHFLNLSSKEGDNSEAQMWFWRD